MRKVAVHALIAFVTGGTLVMPVLCSAYELDPQLDCKSNAHDFISQLLNSQYIEPNPMRVEANSINAFRPIHGSNLTAFGFRVYAVLGYERDDAIFKQGSGEPISDSAYGAVVNGPAETVESRVREAGSQAVVKQVVPLLVTAILCDGR
ncbi:hypothetical protein [Paraburkholderia saeva]|jgi:hypothetical protein|uniref:Uncharacterized protein n=1 Tax=Paraburkholderia saeva TaxID=2777537 RepID=A0A9N8RVJ3_9BURK|nr:hypothetical protein [Paraburkholderia saeva]CAG4897522.1 hypothetical protein LMG31841_02480 [Paraburkholderia saeva]CAG4913580.1 hypothetical protein R52603_04145 [Paraburkholderia saeva]CAG4919633.1 hypothetical protein R70241_04766 [Paraburkholderia saeva]